MIAESRSEFDPEKRKKLLQRSFSILLEDVPAFWLWRLNILYGVDTNKVEYTPTPHNRTFGTEMIVKKLGFYARPVSYQPFMIASSQIFTTAGQTPSGRPSSGRQ